MASASLSAVLSASLPVVISTVPRAPARPCTTRCRRRRWRRASPPGSPTTWPPGEWRSRPTRATHRSRRRPVAAAAVAPAAAVGLGLELAVSLVEDVSLPATREISVDRARACAPRCVATTVSAAATCGARPTAVAAAEASALSRRAWSNGPSSSSTGGGLGGDWLQADTPTPSTARAAPPASTPRLLMTGTALGTATSCHQNRRSTVGTVPGPATSRPITALIAIPGVSLIVGSRGTRGGAYRRAPKASPADRTTQDEELAVTTGLPSQTQVIELLGG